MPSSGRRYSPFFPRHALQTRRTAAACEAEQHCLRLVVEGVPEQHGGRSGLRRRFCEGGVARIAGGGLRPARSADGHRHHHNGVKAESLGLAGGCGCDIRGSGLKAVVDNDSPSPEPGALGLERRRGGQRERVRAAAECDQHEFLG
jgi:hypothetical protein